MGKYLHLQISLFFAMGTLVLVLIMARYAYNSSYKEQVTDVRQATIELMETVAEPATVASYLDQKDMLEEVANGLEKNSIVFHAKLITTRGTEVSAGPPPPEKATAYTVHMVLTSPFAKGKVGDLIVVQNKKLIEQRAHRTGWTNALTLIIGNLLVVVFAAFFINFFLTRAIRKVDRQLSAIKPDSDDRLSIPRRHRDNEFGSLVDKINYLLDKTRQKVDSERHLRKEVEELHTKYQRIFERACSAIFISTPTGEITLANIAFQKIREMAEKTDNPKANICQMFADSSLVEEMLRTTVNTRQAVSNDLLFYKEDGEERWFHAVLLYNENSEGGDDATVEGIFYDITDRYIQEKESQRQAERDHLTALYNRQGVENRFRQHLGRRGGQEDMTLLMLDLDGFKQINDTYGHDVGDMILVKVAKRLIESCRATDTVARWGGDEFVIILYGGYSEEDCFSIGYKILENLTKPIKLGDGVTESIGASIGISTLGQNGFDKKSLLKSADKAMYQVKKRGKNGACFYNAEGDSMICKMFRPERTE